MDGEIMNAQARLQKLERIKPNTQEDSLYQTLRDNGTVEVRWHSGRATVEADPLPGVKTYRTVSPADWDIQKQVTNERD
jgi:hypothetical protein